jgi:hypothetical protein
LTTLKILSRITEPSEGLIRLRGRMASLLNLKTQNQSRPGLLAVQLPWNHLLEHSIGVWAGR